MPVIALALLSLAPVATTPTPAPSTSPTAQPAATAEAASEHAQPAHSEAWGGIERWSVGPVWLSGRDAEDTFLWHRTLGYDIHAGPALATRRPYPAGRADDVRRPGFNGSMWVGESHWGGVQHHWPVDSGSPGAASYGATGREDEMVFVNLGPYVVAINPWESIDATGKERPAKIRQKLEDARNEWLKERGYVGGVRTHVNDAHLHAPVARATDFEPAAVIQAPTDQPKLRSKMQVRNDAPKIDLRGATRVSVPVTVAPEAAAVAANVNATHGAKASELASK